MNTEILSARTLNVPVETAYLAFSNPKILASWWGPEGFTNTIHQFDLQPKGKWKLTMHGPEKGNYENESVFTKVIPNVCVTWTRLSQPYFDMEVLFEKLTETTSSISFRMIFKTAEECAKMKPYVEPKNEENFDRLERVLSELSND